MVRSLVLSVALALMLPATALGATDFGRGVYNVLPPGQFGGLPLTKHSGDQLPLYDGLTPLWDQVSGADITKHFKPERFGVVGKVEQTERPRKGLTIKRDSWGVPHVYGKTRDLVEFGAGWVTAEDRGLFIETIRGPSRVAALDIPGVDPFKLATSLGAFAPSRATERFVASSANRLKKDRQGRRMLKDVDAYVAGINAYYKKTKNKAKPWTRNDVAAAASLIGAVFGKAGGKEVLSSRLLSGLQTKFGPAPGFAAWRDLAERNDADSFTTTSRSFPYNNGGDTIQPGNVVVDPPATASAASSAVSPPEAEPLHGMSNALLVGAKRSANGRPVFVMGPQVGYFYPGFLMELDLHGGGIDARGVAFPGVSLYVLLGRGKDFSFSATSAYGDVVDQFLEELCNPDGSPPTAQSTHYLYKGKCRAMGSFNAGVLKTSGQPDKPISYHTSVHGPIGDIVSAGPKLYAVALDRSTRGRDVESARFFEKLNANKVRSARDFVRAATKDMLFTFNWFYADNRDIAFASTGRLPIRSRNFYPGLPTLGTGQYDWRGFLAPKKHAQAINPGNGVLLNWNNRPARNWGAADDTLAWSSTHRVQLFKGIDQNVTLPELVSVMNRAATQDLRAVEVWPTIKGVLATGGAPDPITQQAAALVSNWSAAGGSRLDRDGDGRVDDPGAAVLDAAWRPLATAVLQPVLGDLIPQLAALEGSDGRPNNDGNAYGSGWDGYLPKEPPSPLRLPGQEAYNPPHFGEGGFPAFPGSPLGGTPEAPPR